MEDGDLRTSSSIDGGSGSELLLRLKNGTVWVACLNLIYFFESAWSNPQNKDSALDDLVDDALLQGGTYDASAKMMTDGLRIGVVKPYSDTPTLNVQQGDSDGELAFEFSGDDMNLTEDREFLKAVHGGSDDIRCQYLDACSKHVRTDVQDPRPN
ncbi:hypothetical protein PR003_g22312 [Phytophthora rubi]|uniref:Uncharacterized protein n=1 Tax=Phytophthora rubi TaxID=129364 RepID=A0A6A4D6R8_9STRA|nr:hypothetical protein PR002_g21619 [Phytophthora rubi]KAE9302268.1 hypothetical protein PR003_g22312 [Phytophthora rubi]